MTTTVNPDLTSRFKDATLTRLGSGSIGAKAREILLAQQTIPKIVPAEFPGIKVCLPRTTILTTELFDAFMLGNGLHPKVLAGMSDGEIGEAFVQAEMPAEYGEELSVLACRRDCPLAVRSSPVLAAHPLSGVFATKLIPNNHRAQQQRLCELASAIKLIWASAFFAKARAYFADFGQSVAEVSMAVIVQEVVGQPSGDRFYPCISGLARSHNFYPSGQARPEEGTVALALGLGKTINDGGLVWSYGPDHPSAPPPFYDLGDLLKYTQTLFWAVNLGKPDNMDRTREEQYLVQEGLPEAEADGALKFLVSTYNLGSDRLHSGLAGKGPRALTFAPLLGSRLGGFNRLLCRLLELFKQALDSPVAIEFAVNLDRHRGLPAQLALLQVQPMLVPHEKAEVAAEEMLGPDVLVASEAVLGNGRRENIRDIVFLKPERFDVASTRLIAHQLASINAPLEDLGGEYLLVGFGRWGTSDPWLGMPVGWNQISAARAIIEVTLPNIASDLSQGSHFFQYLLSYQILYLAVEDGSSYQINWEWLRRQEIVTETEYVAHVRAAQPLDIRVDGASSRGVIRFASPAGPG
ncbi:MAG: hypothetical protein GY867_06640 [bacterium]|nr:hypothetical protein [bacterium]